MPQIANANAYPQTDRLTIGTTLLRGQYVIRDYLADGGFAQTYLAEDSLGRLVVVKECYLPDICIREDGHVRPHHSDHEVIYRVLVAQFVKEARRLARLIHPNIVKVHQVFEENGTAYMALDHVEGDDLHGLLEHAPERLTPDLVERILRTTLEALDFIHEQGLLHRDIAPDNLMIGPDESLTVIDFGSALDLTAGPQKSSELLAVKDGYSPCEFYDRSGHHSPASDLYALGATVYHLITRKCPVSAQDRSEALANGKDDPLGHLDRGTLGYERKVLKSIGCAMSLDPAARPQSAREWLEMLDGARSVNDAPVVHRSFPELDPDLEARVTELVKAARQNASKDPGLPLSTPRTPASQTIHTAPTQPRQLVDMFGTPIKDVDAWLHEQDRMKSRKKPQSIEQSAPEARTDDTQPVESSNVQKPRSSSVFSRLFGNRRKPKAHGADH